jgi:hypothetical protein
VPSEASTQAVLIPSHSCDRKERIEAIAALYSLGDAFNEAVELMTAIQDSPKLESRVPNAPFEGLDLDDRARSRHGACTPFILKLWAVQKWSQTRGLQKGMSVRIWNSAFQNVTFRKNYSTST